LKLTEANKKMHELFRELNVKEDEIIKEAEANGIWKPGLDSNRDLFKEVEKEYFEKIFDLKNQVDEIDE